MKNNLKALSLIFIIATGLISCKGKDAHKTITLSYVNWAEGVAMTTVAKTVLEENGFKVKYKLGDINPILSAISRVAYDAFLDVWMPVTHREYMQKYGKSIEVLGVNYEDARTGLVVPSYVPINSIEELNRNKSKFNNRITGIDIGAGIMKTTEDAIRKYNLDYELTVS